MEITYLVPIVVSAASGCIGALVVGYWARPKIKEETNTLILTQMKVYVDEIKEDRKLDREEIKKNIEEIRKLKQDNEECEYRGDVLELKIELYKKQMEQAGVRLTKEMIYVLDDAKNVTMLFKFRFDKISIFETHVFTDTNLFLNAVRQGQPPILILDYQLQDVVADDVIEQLGYEPEIIIMSADKQLERKFIERGIRFFHKDENYVIKIAKAVVEHMLENLKNQ